MLLRVQYCLKNTHRCITWKLTKKEGGLIISVRDTSFLPKYIFLQNCIKISRTVTEPCCVQECFEKIIKQA